MFPTEVVVFAPRRLGLGAILLACSTVAVAQIGGPTLSGGSTQPGGVVVSDSLKGFHRTMALQATSGQIADFQVLVNATNLAIAKLKPFAQGPAHDPESITSLDRAVQDALTASKKFQSGLSEAQKSGLRDFSRRLEKEDSDLEEESRRLDQAFATKPLPPDAPAHFEAMDKALAEFSNAQLAMGREMSIVLANGRDLTFNLPEVKNPVTVVGRTFVVEVSGSLSQTRAEGGLRTFQLAMTGDLVDMQHSMTELMNSQLGPQGSCGERLSVRQATIMPAAPASTLVLQLHYERWSCSMSTELAEGNGTAEIKLTPTVGASNDVRLAADFSRIDAHGMLGESLRSGDLGADLRDKAAKLLSQAVQSCTNFHKTLPEALQGSPALQSARFQEVGAGGLGVVLEGQVHLSNEQVNALAGQLNQTLAAQGSATR